MNIGMHSMQELFFFGQVGWGGTVCKLNVLIFLTEKRRNFKNDKNRRKKTEKYLISLLSKYL